MRFPHTTVRELPKLAPRSPDHGGRGPGRRDGRVSSKRELGDLIFFLSREAGRGFRGSKQPWVGREREPPLSLPYRVSLPTFDSFSRK